ncbi:L,D-transpeptidase [Nordella sp. HKS 07]|uniref:L,D-transpeptidase n=1 Tax=Nordella sp. HKS 07 TaxID=2712222 RepID=UPI0013E11E5C|nr:L,D-transpeptidase [Nordella sp. HKS 07]QIG46439.1 L,D-transpeptidase [Nordella sp. HKS 07]
MNRRRLLAAGGAALAGLVAKAAQAQQQLEQFRPGKDYNDLITFPPTDLIKIPKKFRRQIVPYEGRHWPGTIIVNTAERHLYLILDGGQAIRYGVGVGREGFRWAGLADVQRKVMWPRWTPPPEMVERDPNAAKWKDGMPGGPDNPLGARALYLFQNGRDTLYRLHGTNAPESIGKALSSGCIRMINEDVIELYRRAPIGSRVVVLAEGV